MTAQLAESPLARSKGVRELRFRDVVRTDLPENLSDEQRRRALYRLRVIGSVPRQHEARLSTGS